MSYFVKDYMDKTYSSVSVDATVREAAKEIAANPGHGFVVVTEGGKPKGTVTARGITVQVVSARKDPDKVKAGDIMATPLVSVDPDEDLVKASAVMQRNNTKRLVVVKGGVVYGVLSEEGVARGCSGYVDKSTRDVLKWAFPVQI